MAGARPAGEVVGVVAALKRHLTPAPVPTEPFQMILWENIGYLVDDPRRRELYDAFEDAIGLDPAAIAQASDAELMPLAKRGGMRPETRVERWRTLARLQAALSMLAAGDPVGRVAGRVGYDTPSAFVAAFRRETGQTPGTFFSA